MHLQQSFAFNLPQILDIINTITNNQQCLHDSMTVKDAKTRLNSSLLDITQVCNFGRRITFLRFVTFFFFYVMSIAVVRRICRTLTALGMQIGHNPLLRPSR